MWKNPNNRAAAAAPDAAPVASAVPPPAPPPPPAPVAPPVPVAQAPVAAPPAAAALPSIQPTTPPTAAPAPTVAAPRATRRRTTQTAAAAQPAQTQPTPVAPQPLAPLAPPVATPAPAPQPTPPVQLQPRTVITPGQGVMSVFAPRPGAIGGLSALAALAAEMGGKPNIFPTLALNNTGQWLPDEMNNEGESDDLPVGNQPILGIALSYRLKAVMWPFKQERGSAHRPKWDAIIGPHDLDLITLFFRAYKNYQMGDRGKRSAVFDPLGHPSGVLEVLVYEQQAGLMVVQSHSSYDSAVQSGVKLHAVFPNGQPQPTPVRISLLGETRQGSAGVPWVEYILDIAQMVCPETQAAGNEFMQFIEANNQDPDLQKAMSDWMGTSFSNEQIATLQAIAAAPAR